jgi:hypothetical protein
MGLDAMTTWVVMLEDLALDELSGQLVAVIRDLFPDRVPSVGTYPTQPVRRNWLIVASFNDDTRTTQEDAELVLKHLIGDPA